MHKVPEERLKELNATVQTDKFYEPPTIGEGQAMAEELLELRPKPIENVSDAKLRFFYKNYKGEEAWRSVIPIRIWFGTTEWHPEPGWLLRAIDTDKGAERDFAFSGIRSTYAGPFPVFEEGEPE